MTDTAARKTFSLKSCPRCSGDLIMQRDHYSRFLTCLQCGYAREIVEASTSMGPIDWAAEGGRRRRSKLRQRAPIA